MPTVHLIDKELTHVALKDLLFCICCGCLSEINWRHYDATFMLYANCCTLSLRAFPVRPDLEVYAVQAVAVQEAQNVVRLPKKEAPSALPPLNHG